MLERVTRGAEAVSTECRLDKVLFFPSCTAETLALSTLSLTGMVTQRDHACM